MLRKILLTLGVALFTMTAQAGTAFFVRDYVSGMNRICIYDHLGSQVAITIRAASVCPITIQV